MTYSPEPTTLDQALKEIRALRQMVKDTKAAINQCRVLLKLANDDTQSAKDAMAKVRKTQHAYMKAG